MLGSPVRPSLMAKRVVLNARDFRRRNCHLMAGAWVSTVFGIVAALVEREIMSDTLAYSSATQVSSRAMMASTRRAGAIEARLGSRRAAR